MTVTAISTSSVIAPSLCCGGKGLGAVGLRPPYPFPASAKLGLEWRRQVLENPPEGLTNRGRTFLGVGFGSCVTSFKLAPNRLEVDGALPVASKPDTLTTSVERLGESLTEGTNGFGVLLLAVVRLGCRGRYLARLGDDIDTQGVNLPPFEPISGYSRKPIPS
jgi:hypothetical protein